MSGDLMQETRVSGMGDPSSPVPGFPPGSMAMKEQLLRRNVKVKNPHGFHVRPAAAVAEAARRFQSRVTVINGDRRSDARQVLELIMLCAEPGAELTLEVSGPDAEEALEVLALILGADEPPPAPPPPKG